MIVTPVAEREFAPSPELVRAARRFVTDLVPDAVADEAALLTSEVVTNAVRHADTPLRVRVVTAADRVRVEVADSSAILPAVRDMADDAESGRGLHIVELVAAAWGVQADDHGGKSVWFELALPQP